MFTGGGLVLAFLLSLWLVVKEWLRDPLIIEPFDAPKELQDLGLTGAVLSQQLYDAILDLQRNARPDDGPADIAFVELPRLQVDLQLPGMSWSIRGVIRYLKQAVGRTERRLVGEVFRSGELYVMRLRSATGRAVEVDKRFVGASDLPATLAAAAEVAVMLTNSLEGATILYSQETPRTRYVKTLAALRFHLSSAPARTHQDAYVLWASVCRALGDQAGMESRLALARAAETSRWSGAETHRLRPRYLNFTGSLAREWGRFDEAREAFTKARAHERRNVGALTNLGLLSLDVDDLNAAQRWFRTLVRLRPTSSRGYRGLGLLAEKEGDWKAAVRWLTRAVDLAPRSRWPRVNRIDALRVIGQLDAAQLDADAFLLEDPDFAPLYRFRSLIDTDRGDFRNARDWALRATEVDPTDPWAFVFLARTAQRLGESAQVSVALDRALSLRADMPEAIRCRAAALAAQADDVAAIAALSAGASANQRDLWCLLELAELQRQRGCHAAALEAADAALQRRANDPQALRRWAWVLRDLGDLRGAEMRLRQAAAAWPRDVTVQRDLAENLRRQRRFEESLVWASSSVSGGVRPGQGHVQAARVHRDCHRCDGAEASLRAAVTEEPDDVTPVVELADLLRRQERFDEALATLSSVPATRAANATLLRRRAAILVDLGDIEAAADRFAQALAASPGDVDLLVEVAEFERGRGRLEAALAHADRALALRKDVLAVWRLKAALLEQVDDTPGAEAALRAAIAWAPGDIWARVSLCSLWRRKKRFDEAADVAAALIARRPDSAEGHVQAAWVQHSRGDVPGARNCFAAALRAAPAHELRPRLQYADFLHRHDEHEAVLEQADAVLLIDPMSVEALDLIFSANLDAKREAAAIAAAEGWAAIARDEVEPWLRLADLHDQAQRPEAALECLERALVRRPTSLRVRRELLRLAIKRQDWQEGARWVEELCGLAPVEVQDLLTWAHACSGREHDPAAQGAPSEALREALNAARRALERQPRCAQALRLAADLHERLGDPAAAETAWRVAIEADSKDESASDRLATLLQGTGRPLEAVEVLRSALAFKPTSTGLLHALANAWLAAGRRPQALRAVARFRRLTPDTEPSALLYLGWLLMQFGFKRKAADCAQRAAALPPLRADVLRRAAKLLKHAGRMAESDELGRAAQALEEAD